MKNLDCLISTEISVLSLPEPIFDYFRHDVCVCVCVRMFVSSITQKRLVVEYCNFGFRIVLT
ncbi:hypothetical protein O3M35_009707 [Rhynocoris fuscipes]|uniref:Uncharacterized protein n=1 Tax=Rhynocoris fuscipes TaxID=488301 RepID=A0AAW1D577_9HEMI